MSRNKRRVTGPRGVRRIHPQAPVGATGRGCPSPGAARRLDASDPGVPDANSTHPQAPVGATPRGCSSPGVTRRLDASDPPRHARLPLRTPKGKRVTNARLRWATRCPSYRAIELWADDEGSRGDLNVAGKMTSLVSDAPSDPILYPERWSRTTLARLRLGLDVHHNDWMDSEWAYEQRARWLSVKTVLGASYTFNVGNGLTLLAEHHYSGFGVEDAEDALMRLQEKDFQNRLLRGDMQILGRQAVAAQLGYPFNEAVSGSFLVLTNPADGSGVLSPSLRLDLDRHITFLASAFVPWGDEPSAGRLRSEHGATPASLFLQMSMYY